jgi:glycosyltransferase involved in cell wall biosynthesis
MIIGIDATCWANGRGYGRFARELMRAMTRLAPDDQFVCFGDRRSFEAYPDPAPNVRLVAVAVDESPTVAASADSHRSLTDLLRLTRAVSREKLDAFFSPSVYTFFPLPPGLPAVVTIHDTIPERFPALTLPTRRARFFWSLKIRLALMQARVVLTVSEYSAKSIAQVLHVPRHRIRVTVEAPAAAYHPVGPDEVRAAARRAGLPDEAPWFIYVGGFNPHKRVDLILRAHAALVGVGPSPPHLLLVGSRSGDVFHKAVEQLDGIVRDAGTGQLVHWTGFVADEELRPLLAGATALLLPSEAEGFGLPAVEAAACGTPVIATVESPLPDLLTGGGIFVKPGDLAGLQDAMRRLLEDPALRATMGRRALEKAAALSWDRGADAAMAAIRECFDRTSAR